MTPEQIYRHAYATAYDALLPYAQHAQIRSVLAEAVAAHLIGDGQHGQHGRGRWMAVTINEDRRRLMSNALVRDLGRHDSLTIPPHHVFDAVLRSVASALLDATAPSEAGVEALASTTEPDHR